MNPALRAIVAPLLSLHEGSRRFPYIDTVGKVTIGVGRNLTDNGLSSDEISYLFDNDLRHAEADARLLLGATYDALSQPRQAVMIDMAFNLGARRLSEFRNMLLAIREARYTEAAHQMLASTWAQQVGSRATTLAAMMAQG